MYQMEVFLPNHVELFLLRVLLLAPCPCSAVLALLLSSCCNQESAHRISSPVRFKHETEFISLHKSPHMWALAPPWQIRHYEKDRSETWTQFMHSTHCHCDFCHVLEVFLLTAAFLPTAGALTSWTGENCSKDGSKWYIKEFVAKQEYIFFQFCPRILEIKGKIYSLEQNIHHWVLWPLCYFLPSCV